MSSIALGEVQETMLIPLSIKASETLRPKARIQDEKAVEIIRALNVSTEKFDKFMSHEGVVARTIMFDRTVKEYLERYPESVCINMGCGLDNRFSRVDNGKVLWYDLDLADAIQVRRQFFPQSSRVHMIEGSVLEEEWTKEISAARPVIVIAEGLFMYFSKDEVGAILKNLSQAFPCFVLIAELMSVFTSGKDKYHDTVKNTNATFKWGTKSGKELELLCPGLKLVKENSFNDEMKRYTLRGWLFAAIPKVRDCNNRLAVFEYERK